MSYGRRVRSYSGDFWRSHETVNPDPTLVQTDATLMWLQSFALYLVEDCAARRMVKDHATAKSNRSSEEVQHKFCTRMIWVLQAFVRKCPSRMGFLPGSETAPAAADGSG
jgi:hypothetical protein